MQKTSKSYRISHASDFQQLFDVGKKIVTPSHVFIINANELGHYRLGFVINKKRVALAIDRNRIKRLMREFFRIQCQSIGIDVVMIVKRDTSKYSNEQLREELKILWEAVKRYCKIS